MKQSVTAFAPASVANLAVGFDILGFAFDALGDQVTVERIEKPKKNPILIGGIDGIVKDLPSSPEKNTATAGLLLMREELNLKFGFRVTIQKGIPKSSGLGGSAASAIASVFAANALLDQPLSREKLLRYGLAGEAVASGALHADNVAPCLFGGLQLVQSMDPLRLQSLPFPSKVRCVIIHPDVTVETKTARKILKDEISLALHTQQSALLASFIIACFRNDLALMKESLCDLVIEPQRSHLVPAYAEMKDAALQSGAFAFTISGSGPSVFAFAKDDEKGERVKAALEGVMHSKKIHFHSWIGPMSSQGARLV